MTSYVAVNANVTPTTYRDGFVRAYQEAFAGPPYFENYTQEQVLEEVWYPHLEDGIIILAFDDEQVVGFGCALPLTKAPDDVREFLAEQYHNGSFPAPATTTWYMSELGVLEPYRRRGIGSNLVKHRLMSISHRGDSHYVFRTAAEGSNSIEIYRRIGSTELTHLQDLHGHEQVEVNGSHSTERIYLYGRCDDAIKSLPAAS